MKEASKMEVIHRKMPRDSFNREMDYLRISVIDRLLNDDELDVRRALRRRGEMVSTKWRKFSWRSS